MFYFWNITGLEVQLCCEMGLALEGDKWKVK